MCSLNFLPLNSSPHYFLLNEDNTYLIKLLESLNEVTYVKTCKMHGICILNFPNTAIVTMT